MAETDYEENFEHEGGQLGCEESYLMYDELGNEYWIDGAYFFQQNGKGTGKNNYKGAKFQTSSAKPGASQKGNKEI